MSQRIEGKVDQLDLDAFNRAIADFNQNLEQFRQTIRETLK